MEQATAEGSGRAGPSVDPELDFFARTFNPLRALLAEGLAPPLPAARPLDSVSRCRFMLPPGHPDAWKQAEHARKSKEAVEAGQREKSRLAYVQQKRARDEQKRNPLDEIAERVREGPLLLLKRCYQQRLRVRVVTRHARGVRGSAEGVLVAFDKHMNLVLRDVEERYTVLLRVQKARPPAPGGSGQERMRWAREQEHRQRQLRQVFVRGDSVVLVAAVAAEGGGGGRAVPAPAAAVPGAAAAAAAEAAGAGASAAAGQAAGPAAGRVQAAAPNSRHAAPHSAQAAPRSRQEEATQ